MAKIYGNTTTTPMKPELFGDEEIKKEAIKQSKDYTDEKVGNIETALDNIIAIQNQLIGGGSV